MTQTGRFLTVIPAKAGIQSRKGHRLVGRPSSLANQAVDSRLRVCCQTTLGSIEIATATFGGLAMTKKSGLGHCEERLVLRSIGEGGSDEAISTLATSPCEGMTNVVVR
jgi:hypothetical protein